ncbi:uncharacterized protein LOC128895501 isoform X2 [Hylaeus anthracinus]|uniref:uncharacterized protein LOC128895501 isoform X2 n=1 Tax=Hylaeus anthracinus TaxID=313031 RepID=UPI0023B8B650|nr:uncharacterized protein LOC128895501 isoform X2 [Hylaeus anthracinus]
MTSINKKTLGQKGKGVCKFPMKQRSVTNMATQKETTEEKKVNYKGHAESVYNKRFDDTDYDDPITMLRKEIQDWRINEILTARTEERLSGTPSEPRTYSYVASGETTKRQQSPNDPLKSCRTFVNFLAETKDHDTLEYLDLRKETVPRSSASCHSKMHSRSVCDCYCKIVTPRTHRKNEIQSERGRARLVASKRSISKTDAIRSARKVPSTPATLVDEDQADSKRSTFTLPISPILSPQTSAALEDVERLVKDAQIQIKGISMVANSNRVPTNFNTYLDEVTLDDEKDQLLYVRERVAQKFHESNGWIDGNYVDPAARDASKEGKPPIRLKNTTDFSAPKFRTSKDLYKEFSSYAALFGNQNPEPATQAATNVIEKEKKANDPEQAEKVGTFAVQAGPSVNIERSLIAQNLEMIRISPDPFFVQESANVGTYTICHDHWNVGPSAPKAKFMKIPYEPRGVENNVKPIGNPQGRKNSKQLNGVEKLVESTSHSTSDSMTLEGTKNDSPENNGKTEDSGKPEEKILDNEKSLESESVDPENEKKSKPEEDRAQSLEAVREERREKATAEARNDQATKQVRFDAEITKKPENPVETRNEEISMLERDLEIFEGTESNGRNAQESKGHDRSTSKRIVEECKQTRSVEEKREKRLEGTSEKDELERNERYRIVDERFANILRKYRIEKEVTRTNERLVSSSSTNSFAEDLEEADELGDLYCPSIDDLDNVLTAYDKIINDVSLSTRTIEKFLTRPELEEYYAQEANAPPSISREPLSTANASQSKRQLDYSSESSDKIAKISCSRRARDESSSLTSCSVDPLSPSTDLPSVNDDRPLREMFKSSVESIADETTRFRPGLTSTQEIKKRTCSQKGDHDYTSLYDLVYNDILKRGFPESWDPKNMTERLISCALEEEKRFIEEKIKTDSNVNCVESLLEHLQNDPPTSQTQNLELFISENAMMNETASADLHVAETARAMSKSEEGKSEIEKEDASRGSNRQAIIVESVFNSKSQSSSGSKEDNERSSGNETSKIYSNNESSQEKTRSKATNDRTNFNGNDHAIPQNDAQLKTEQNNNEKSSANEPIENSETEILKTMENEATDNSNNNLKDVAVEAIASFSRGAIPELKTDKSIGSHLAQDKAGVPAQSISNVIHVSPSDSLRDCASLESSPKNVSKISSNAATPKREFNKIEQLRQTSNCLNGDLGEITNRRGLYHGNVIEKEKILADLYDDVHMKLLFSTLDTNCSNAVDQDYRTSNSVSSVKLNKVEALSSDTSRSEGELCMASSGSYSLGEVKVLSTDACANSVTVFVTKEMLNSWNESSKSLIQSMGEI